MNAERDREPISAGSTPAAVPAGAVFLNYASEDAAAAARIAAHCARLGSRSGSTRASYGAAICAETTKPRPTGGRGFGRFLAGGARSRVSCYFASSYSPSPSQLHPSPAGEQCQVPFPLIPFSLPVPAPKLHVPLAAVGLPSFNVVVPWKGRDTLSPLSILST